MAVAFSPDGNLVMTGSLDRTARIFESHRARVPEFLRGCSRRGLGASSPGLSCEDASVRHVDIVGGGRYLRAVTGSHVLNITEDQIRASDRISAACAKLERNLTREEWDCGSRELDI